MTKLYARVGLPTRIPDYIDREALVKKLYTDKKVRDGKLRFVIEKGIGDVVEFAPNVYANRSRRVWQERLLWNCKGYTRTMGCRYSFGNSVCICMEDVVRYRSAQATSCKKRLYAIP